MAAQTVATHTDEGVVRVTARSLTRLTGLAGESLVEARWLQPFSKSLLHLKQLQTQLHDTLEDLDEAVQSQTTREQCDGLLGDAHASGWSPAASCWPIASDSSTGACAMPTT